MKRLLRILAAVLPAVAFLAVGEVAVRIGAWAEPELLSLPFPGEDKLMRPDAELFWALRPNLDIRRNRKRIRTNSLGLRSSKIETKRPGEIRILSLGESTAFGQGVSNDQTYANFLEDHLNTVARDAGRGSHFRVINAGVPAYSSFQSLKYLELRGIDLQPDVVLLYHEVNDYLPSTIRGSDGSELSFGRTDAQLYESRTNAARRVLMGNSALLRFLDLRLARYRIDRFQEANVEAFEHGIGLPAFELLPRILAVAEDGYATTTEIRERALPQRVSEDERAEILEAFQRFCAERGIRLVAIHPSYNESSRHRCLLTEIYDRQGVPTLEAYDVLHPPGVEQAKYFIDSFHPNAAGHRRLAEALAPIVLEIPI